MFVADGVHFSDAILLLNYYHYDCVSNHFSVNLLGLSMATVTKPDIVSENYIFFSNLCFFLCPFFRRIPFHFQVLHNNISGGQST